jgi:HAD superfamily hydrolase (TIGR01484 family)
VSRDLPRPFKEASPDELRKILGVCLDIDDTLSTEGKLEAPAYQALWRLKQAGFWVIPITGRPAGWCDLIARFWPVDAVVGENGAFTFYLERQGSLQVRKRLDTPKGASDESLKRSLADLDLRIQDRFPFARKASDQAYREYDLAIDICEAVPPWSREDVQSLLDFCRDQGAHAKLSSIHVNIWFGDYDKRRGFESGVLQGLAQVRRQRNEGVLPRLDQWVYVGDSPNDEPLFEGFSCSVGVANLKPYFGGLKFFPTWITEHASGSGFVEMADQLMRVRQGES